MGSSLAILSMGRSPPPPRDFHCPYQHHCPYLEGLSTDWVWEEYQRGHIEQQEQEKLIEQMDQQLQQAQQQIEQLQRELTQTQAELQRLHRSQFKANQPTLQADAKPTPTASAAPPAKKRGAPPGHPGWQRPVPIHIDQRVQLKPPTQCQHCGSRDLLHRPTCYEHIQEDIRLEPKTVVTCFVHPQAECRRCHQPVLQPAPGELLHAPIGPVAKSTSIYLRYRMGLPYRKIQRLFEELFGLRFVPASAFGFDRQAVRKGLPLYEDLRAKIRASAYLHADETHWRVDGVNHFLWYAGHDRLAFFHIDRHRSAEVAQAILGESFAGTLICDEFAAYNAAHPADRQSCLAHPLRLARDLLPALDGLRAGGILHPEAEAFARGVHALLQDACQLGPQHRTVALSPRRAEPLQRDLLRRLDRLCKASLAFEPAETLRQRLCRSRPSLFTFLRRPEIEPTNNQAERSLRASVILRKITFGNRSWKGAQNHGILTSLIQTAGRQGRDVRGFLRTLLLCDTATAQAALYNNST